MTLLRKHVGTDPAGDDRPGGTRCLATDITLIAVGTPFDGREIDLTAVLGAAAPDRDRAAEASTATTSWSSRAPWCPAPPTGMCCRRSRRPRARSAGVDFGVGMNPEFLSEGEAVNDFLFPDRIVLGGIDERTHRRARASLYEPFRDVPRLRTNTRTAEMIKYASQRAAGHADLVLQRAGEPGRRARRHRHGRGHARRAPQPVLPRPQQGRPAAHHGVSGGGLRIRRQLPAEGRERADRPWARPPAIPCRCWRR